MKRNSLENKSNLFYDLIDQASMIIYEDLQIDYLECFIRVANDVTDNFDDSRLSEESVRKLKDIYEVLYNESFTNEEVRSATQLLIVKGFKHIDYSLDLMTPDTINYIIGYIVLKMYQGKKIDILDTTIGTGNMINSIVNLEGVDADRILGIENNEKLARLALANSKLQDNEITIYLQDVLNDIHDTVDVVVGDLESYNHEVGINNINYFPYVTILNRLKNIKDDGLFIYLIDNDFFQKDEAMAFKTIFDNHATLLGLIVLPKTAFAFNHIGKSIIIGKKTLYQNYDMTVQRLPSFHNEDELSSFLKHLSEWIKQIK